MDNARRTAAFAVARYRATRAHADTLIPDTPDRAFVQDMVYTAIRHWRTIAFALDMFVQHRPTREAEALLAVGAAQILFMPSVADYAAVNETVAAARMTNRRLSGFVNAVLRSMLRRRGEVLEKIASAPLGLRESFPDALVRRWVERYGAENAGKLAAWHNTPAETWLARKHAFGEPAVFEKLSRSVKVQDVPGYDAGEFIVQDPATAKAVELLDVHPGMSVLDACAAPGGKTVQIAWRMEGRGKLLALEPDEKRLVRLNENLARCHLDFVRAAASLEAAGEKGLSSSGGGFDRILLDVPCSNSGVLRRRPDARWNWSEKRVAEMAEIQRGILDKYCALLKRGGILVYSTCSNEPEENALQIKSFLERHNMFAKIAESESIPFESGHDGAYACSLMLKEE